MLVSSPVQSCSLLDAPRGIPVPPAAENLPEFCSLSPSDLLDVLLKGISWWEVEFRQLGWSGSIQTLHCSAIPQNHLGWKRTPKSLSPNLHSPELMEKMPSTPSKPLDLLQRPAQDLFSLQTSFLPQSQAGNGGINPWL